MEELGNQENGDTGTQETTETTEDLGGEFVESEPEEKETTDTDQATEESGEKIFDQESANKAFIKAKQKQRDAEEKAAKALKEAEDLKAKLASTKATGEPVVPPIPDQFDEDYDKKILERDAAIEARGQYKRDQALKQEQATKAQQSAYEAQQATAKKNIENYQARAKALNLDDTELLQSEKIFDAYVKNPAVSQFLLTHEKGPLAVSYLAKNPQELERIAGMDPMNAAVHISTNIMPNAIKAAPKGTQTPPPLTIPGGRGVVDSDAESRDPNLAGGHFV